MRAYPSGEDYGDSGWLTRTELRYVRGPWNASMTVAWQTQGGTARSDNRAGSPVLWATLLYRF